MHFYDLRTVSIIIMDLADALAEVQAKSKEYVQVKELLVDLPRKLQHSVMIPLSGVGFVEGQIVHSNEFLMALGDGWYRTCTSYQAQEIIDRRLGILEAEQKKLEDMKRPQPKRDFNELMGRMKELEEEEKSGSSAVSFKILEKPAAEIEPPQPPPQPPKERISKFKQERSRAPQ